MHGRLRHEYWLVRELDGENLLDLQLAPLSRNEALGESLVKTLSDEQG